ncbi:MAG: DUF2807 domain-containing protein [Cyanothece sp. SIO1E1]|nr:DUF2807 domain-containing protein [Cyanothece sp. SIO1E1]
MQILARLALITLFFLLVSMAKVRAQESTGLFPFDGISVFGNFEVVLEAGEEETAKIYSSRVPEEDINIFVKKGILKIQMKTTKQFNNDQVKIVVTYKKLRRIRASAGAQIYSDEVITADYLYLKAASGGRVEMDLQVEDLEAHVKEGGTLELEGYAQSQRIGANTGGKFDGFHLEGERVYAKAGTGGTIIATATQSIDASANTGGRIEYRGNPKAKNTRNVFGEIRKI